VLIDEALAEAGGAPRSRGTHLMHSGAADSL
jgi:hypothetical protein